MLMRMKNKKSKKKKRFLIILSAIVCSLFLVFVIPVVINESYKVGTGYLTLWGAADVLAFYAVVLSGLISIGILAVTVYYNRIESQKQIKLARSQVNVPFFAIEQVYQENSQENFSGSQDGQAWKREYEISKYRKGQGSAIIVLRNIGDGIAITPKYQIDLPIEMEDNPPKFVKKDDTLKVPYNLYDILGEKVGRNNITQQFQEFDTCLSLTYQNTLGISYKQEIILHHSMKVNRVAVELMVNSISHQYVEL